ncbi:hypothetical protein A4X09_0g5036 [Tilletia walkeri]|uniref:Uncharacterized protein n=1 Tax=Tilletia walkeri TaxID=117179 RepID=A0A8X7N7B8_9BASI|nr:hypothetical protein A4X09_0g5036 [Tilletia walkeri]
MAMPTAHDEAIYIKPDPEGRSAEDAIPILSDTDSSSGCDELPPLRKPAAQQDQPSRPAPVDLEDDLNAPDWQRAAYFASQRAYADLAYYFRTGEAHFVTLNMTPWEGSQDPIDILDFGWAQLLPSFDKDGRQCYFDWDRQIAESQQRQNGFRATHDMHQAAERVCTAVNVKGARTSWRPFVVHYQPDEGKQCYNSSLLPPHKDNFLFRAFIKEIRPQHPKSNRFGRNITGTYFDIQDQIMLQLNQFLQDLSKKKPVFLLTHCMREDVGYLSKLGIAWQNMNLSFPLSPWFTPREDAEWLKTHRYWRSAWDFTRPQRQSRPANSNQPQHPPSSRDDRQSNSNDGAQRERRAHASGSSLPQQSAQRDRFIPRDMPIPDDSSDDEGTHRSRAPKHPPPPPPSRPEPRPEPIRPITRREFYKVRTIHVVDLYALIDILPHFPERSASYYPAPSRPLSEPSSSSSMATMRKEVAEREKRALKETREASQARAAKLIGQLARSEKQYIRFIAGLQATAIRAGVLKEGDGAGEQFKWWNAGNEAMFMLAVLGKLVDDHPLPNRPPSPKPSPARRRHEPVPSRRIEKSRQQDPLSGILQPPSRQKEQARAQKQQHQQKDARAAVQPRTAVPSTSAVQPRSAVPSTSAVKIGASAGRHAPAPASAPVAVAQRPEAVLRRRDEVGAGAIPPLIPPSQRLAQQSAVPEAEPLTSGNVGAPRKRARPQPELQIPVVQPTLSSSELSSAESEPNVRPRRKQARVYADPSSSEDDFEEAREQDTDEDEDEGGTMVEGSQFTPFYKYMKELFDTPAIYISFAFRDGSPGDRTAITEVGYSILDASKVDARESLHIDTRHYIVKDQLKLARPQVKEDFAFASTSSAGAGRLGGVRHEQILPSGSRIATKRNITNQIHNVLTEALKTDKRVYAVVTSAEDTSYGHRSIIGQEEWPAFYDWRTHHFSADSAQGDMFFSTSLLNRMLANISHSVPGTRQPKMYTIEVRHLFAAVNTREELTSSGRPAGGGQRTAPRDETVFDETVVDVPFPEVCNLLGIKPERNCNLENAGNRAHYTMQAMLEFAYGPASADEFKNVLKARKEAQDAIAVEAQI